MPRIAKIKKTDNTKCWQGNGTTETLGGYGHATQGNWQCALVAHVSRMTQHLRVYNHHKT